MDERERIERDKLGQGVPPDHDAEGDGGGETVMPTPDPVQTTPV